MFMRQRRLLRAAVIGGGAFGAGKRSARRSAKQARPGRPAQQPDDEQNERIVGVEQQQAHRVTGAPGGGPERASGGRGP
jgi:hypothetical protein